MLYRMSCEGEVEDGHAFDAEGGAIDFRVPANIDNHLASAEDPLGLGKLAGGHSSVMHDIVIRTSLFHQFAGESEGSGRSQQGMPAAKTQTRGANYGIEAAHFGSNVIGAVAGLDVLVTRPAIEDYVPFQGSVAGRRVVGDLIRVQNKSPIMNLNLASQPEHGPVFFLLRRPDRNFFGIACWRRIR